MSQIEFKNVSKVYPNGHVGLKNINLNIEKGEFAVIVGLSGAGKSTLLRSVKPFNAISRQVKFSSKVNQSLKPMVKHY